MIKTNSGDSIIAGNRQTSPTLSTLPDEKALMHLLKRCLPGVSFADYHYFLNKSRSEVVNELLNNSFEPSFPVKDYSSVNDNTPDFKVPMGETWVHDIHYDQAVNGKRRESLKKWMVQTLYTQHRSVRARLILLWHRYFPLQMERLTLANKAYDYYATITNHALENFRELVLYQVTNFALLEYHKKIRPVTTPLHKFHASVILDQYLFGDDSSKYISKDRIKRFTRLLNEWNAINDSLSVSAAKRYADAQLPAQVMEKPMIREYMEELAHFINRLMQHEKIAQTLSERLFRWFVHSEIDKGVRLIRKMTDTALDHQYEMRKILSALFMHEQFYDPRYFGCLVKSPLEFTFGICRELGIAEADEAAQKKHYPIWEWMEMQVAMLDQPVGSPLPEKKWIVPEQLKKREALIAQVTANIGFSLLNGVQDATDLDALTGFLINFYSSTHFSAEKKKALYNYIETHFSIGPDSWHTLLKRARENPQDEKAVREAREFTRGLLLYFMNSPEYHFF